MVEAMLRELPMLKQLLQFIEETPIEQLAVAATALILAAAFLPTLSCFFKPGKPKAWLDPTDYKPLKLAQKKFITHNTLKLRFDLPNPKQRLGLPIGQHISFRAVGDDGKEIFRSYTPCSDDDLLGSVVFVIKIYPQGKMSQVLDKLEVGQEMMMRGPKGRLTYQPNMKKQIGMLAGGTGITPMFQVLSAILKNPADKTQVRLVFGNLTEDDILLRAELDELQQMHPQQLKVYHVLNKPPEGWQQGAGFITADIIRAHLPPPSDDTLILQCGPPPMVDAMKKHLEVLGYSSDMQFAF